MCPGRLILESTAQLDRGMLMLGVWEYERLEWSVKDYVVAIYVYIYIYIYRDSFKNCRAQLGTYILQSDVVCTWQAPKVDYS